MNDTSSKSGQVNLGLNEIIEQANGGDLASQNKIVETELENTSGDDQKESTQIENSNSLELSLTSLYDAKDWKGLTLACESRIGNSVDEVYDLEIIQARIFWVRAQFELSAVPVTILAAPIDSVSQLVIENGAVGISPRVLHELKLLLGEACARLEALDEDELADALAIRKDKLTSIVPEVRNREPIKDTKVAHLPSDSLEPPPKVNGLSVHVLEEPSKSAPVAGLTSSNESSESLPTRISGSTTKSKIKFALFLLLAVVAVGGGIFVFSPDAEILSHFQSLKTESARDTLALQNEPPVAIAPISERIERVKDIDAIYFGLKQKDDQQLENEKNALAANIAQKKDSPTPIPKVLEKVDTSYPIEGTVFYPKVNSQKISDVEKGAGSLSKSPGSETVNNTKLYSIISPTTVMSQPSLRAVAMSNLDPGARVEVVEKVGQWLKIRSKRGQAGYILDQDAQLIP